MAKDLTRGLYSGMKTQRSEQVGSNSYKSRAGSMASAYGKSGAELREQVLQSERRRKAAAIKAGRKAARSGYGLDADTSARVVGMKRGTLEHAGFTRGFSSIRRWPAGDSRGGQFRAK